MQPILLRKLPAFFSALVIFLLSFQHLPAQVPTISSIAPLSADVNATVVINGTNFNAMPANNTVYFGAVKATIINATLSSLSVKVPPGTLYQPVSVT